MKKIIDMLKKDHEEILLVFGVTLLLTGFLSTSIIIAYLGLIMMIFPIFILYK